MKHIKLKAAFEMARVHSNIDLIFDEFIHADLYVVAKGVTSSGSPTFFAQPSPTKTGLCITASPFTEVFKDVVDVQLVAMKGQQLLQDLDPRLGVLIVYDDGGDYLDPDQLQWFRSLLAEQ